MCQRTNLAAFLLALACASNDELAPGEVIVNEFGQGFLVDPNITDGTAEGVPKATLMVLITSTTGDNEPGKKWCEDCDAADPVIERVLTASEDRYVLLNALCKRSEYKKALNPDAANYPYRLRPEMNSPTPFAGIPTLVRWEPPYNKIDFPEAETRCYATKAEEAKVVATIEMLLEAD